MAECTEEVISGDVNRSFGDVFAPYCSLHYLSRILDRYELQLHSSTTRSTPRRLLA